MTTPVVLAEAQPTQQGYITRGNVGNGTVDLQGPLSLYCMSLPMVLVHCAAPASMGSLHVLCRAMDVVYWQHSMGAVVVVKIHFPLCVAPPKRCTTHERCGIVHHDGAPTECMSLRHVLGSFVHAMPLL